MTNSKQIAEQATIQSFLNCYLRETGHFFEKKMDDELRVRIGGAESEIEKIISCPLAHQNIELIVPIHTWSLTGRHLLNDPVFYKMTDHNELLELDYVTLVSLITKELMIEQSMVGAEDELILRVILSCRNIKRYIEGRIEDAVSLSDTDFHFIEAEQSLLLGHLLHPTPKSKQGITEIEELIFSPELKGEFQLHYFSADPSLVLEDSSISQQASEIVKDELQRDDFVDHEWMSKYENRVLIPIHPLQARDLMERSKVKESIAKGTLEYLGTIGPKYTATSSFRTLYNKNSDYMLKFSVPVKITNSLRANLQKELDRGVEVARLMETELGDYLRKSFPCFNIVEDPAYLNIDFGDGETSGFDVVIRKNPFKGVAGQQASLIAGLCQDHAFGGNSRIRAIIEEIAVKENRTLEDISLDWFERYMNVVVDPILSLYHQYGIAVEAHQQNSVIQLEDGYPERFYYRDNQGYYYCESKADQLVKLLPDLNRKSQTICADEVAEERLRYYFFFNHLFGLVNGFGVSGLVGEGELLRSLRVRLEKQLEESGNSSSLLKSLLEESELPCKANLLTRFHDMDELVGSLETQSVYTKIANPLVQGVELVNGK
ncbi:IucA/IucC family protein [Pseudalkalibacillus decolorationis]|uniref:IucA/IucC family protein n=1 Tax=Pseudalkalibacillus decolorationis TaxID=163879 RepID=UPI00214973BE|nr:IucA/IucC family protein [Pseudalkalibacillus decolorationis]